MAYDYSRLNRPAAQRGPDGKFLPGASGNPGGKPGGPNGYHAFAKLCRDYSPEALAKIVEIMRTSDSVSHQLDAAKYLLDRAWGKPSVSNPKEEVNAADVSTEDMVRIAKRRIREWESENGEVQEH